MRDKTELIELVRVPTVQNAHQRKDSRGRTISHTAVRGEREKKTDVCLCVFMCHYSHCFKCLWVWLNIHSGCLLYCISWCRCYLLTRVYSAASERVLHNAIWIDSLSRSHRRSEHIDIWRRWMITVCLLSFNLWLCSFVGEKSVLHTMYTMVQ